MNSLQLKGDPLHQGFYFLWTYVTLWRFCEITYISRIGCFIKALWFKALRSSSQPGESLLKSYWNILLKVIFLSKSYVVCFLDILISFKCYLIVRYQNISFLFEKLYPGFFLQRRNFSKCVVAEPCLTKYSPLWWFPFPILIPLTMNFHINTRLIQNCNSNIRQSKRYFSLCSLKLQDALAQKPIMKIA